ncbi:MAG TPA: amino acid racemase [Candidatus Saccharimonadales bacterium]|nr:amino acid racemase [Candidatus Saccharimonadales bacterium]
MGPQASARLHTLILQHSRTQHSGEGHEYPFIVHFSLPVRDFISSDIHKQAAIEQMLALGPQIALLDPASIMLACNTAHLLTDDVPYLQGKNFVSLLKTVARRLHDDGIKTVGLLASPTTIKTKLYERYLTEEGVIAVTPPARSLSIVEDAIRNVITMKQDTSDAAALTKIADALVGDGAQAILLGCTELPLVFDKSTATVPVYDCLDMYAHAVTRR